MEIERMAKKSVQPTDKQVKMLEEVLKERYPEFDKVPRSIVYDKENGILGAVVTFSCENHRAAIFEYRENKEKLSDRFYWYCDRDWMD